MHLFLNLLVGADRRTDEIHDYTRSAHPDELPSLSYSANLSGVYVDALLNPQLTMLGFSSVNYQELLNFSRRLDASLSTFFSELLHPASAQALGILSTLSHQAHSFKPVPSLRKLLKQERRRQLRLVVAYPRLQCGGKHMAYPIRNRQGPFSGPE